jgi:DNA repair exonuclease SbcCD nuclease subunit
MRFLHSADWQLGCAFRSFGAKAPALRACRLATLRRTLEIARRERVDGFLVAGDLFEDNQVAASLLTEVFEMFASAPDLRIFVLPGNHDPINGPGCVWLRPPFSATPSNVTIIREPGVLSIGDGYLLANPLKQKVSTQDPSVILSELAATLPSDALRIGMTHGALAIAGKHQPNDHPIHLQAATRAGLDYLALGHWHRWQTFDDARIIMPGTPEPDAFEHAEGRLVALVNLSRHAEAPEIRSLDVAALSWRSLELDFTDGENARPALERSFAEIQQAAPRHVIRVTLKGPGARGALAATRAWLETVLAPFAATEIKDESKLALSITELAAMAECHPLVARVLSDLAQARAFVTGAPLSGMAAAEPLTYPELQQIAHDLELDLGSLDESFFRTTSDLLALKLQEAEA